MSEAYGMHLVRVVCGEESLAAAFWTSLFLMTAFFAYEYYVPSFADIHQPAFRFFRIFVLTYALVAVHNSCGAAGLIARLASRTYVLLLAVLATYTSVQFYGRMWLAYPLVALAAVFVTHD